MVAPPAVGRHEEFVVLDLSLATGFKALIISFTTKTYLFSGGLTFLLLPFHHLSDASYIPF